MVENEKGYKKIPNRYMVATKAIHELGDISDNSPKLCSIHGEDEKNFIGEWVTGFGFLNVKFPKETTRELTPEEIYECDGEMIAINSSYYYTLRIKEGGLVAAPNQ